MQTAGRHLSRACQWASPIGRLNLNVRRELCCIVLQGQNARPTVDPIAKSVNQLEPSHCSLPLVCLGMVPVCRKEMDAKGALPGRGQFARELALSDAKDGSRGLSLDV
jgi:hypothetical protein